MTLVLVAVFGLLCLYVLIQRHLVREKRRGDSHVEQHKRPAA